MRIDNVAANYNRQKWQSGYDTRRRRLAASTAGKSHSGVIDMIDLAPGRVLDSTMTPLIAYIAMMPNELVREKVGSMLGQNLPEDELLACKLLFEIL
jgi:hypothetical protein